MVKKIKNVSGSSKTWRGNILANNGTCVIPEIEDEYWRTDAVIIQAITDSDAQISGDGGSTWKTGDCAIGLLKMLCSHTCGTNIEVSHTPSSASDTGHPGTLCWDANYIYVCTATDTWKRVALGTW